MKEKEHNGMQCAEFDALLSQAIDGTLSGERLTAFEAHGRVCQVCGPLLQESEAGHGWLKSLAEVEPPADLVTNVLLRTTGVLTSRSHAHAHSPARPTTVTWTDRVREWGEMIYSPVVAAARQPRFAMSFGMAFFTLSVTLGISGVRVSDLRHVDLRPSAVRRNYYETSGRVVKYYENIRFVYEIQARVRQFKEATAPVQAPPEQNNNNNDDRKDKTKNNTSGQPDQKQERNYSQEGSQPVFASLPSADDAPVVPVTTYRRLV
jgi:Putative zinc-finger